MTRESFEFLSLLTKMPLEPGKNCCKIKTDVQKNEISKDEIDWLADYPKVRYAYKVAEVAFLLHKLNQLAHQFKDAKKKEQRRKFLNREEKLIKISENVERALNIFHQAEKEKKNQEKRRNKKNRLFANFGDQARTAVSYEKNSHKEFEAIRVDMVDQFDDICSEEIANVKNLVSAFIEDSILSWGKIKL